MPSLTLLGQSMVSGLLAGGLYALLALGLSLSWGLLRLVNLGHFALAFLGAYLTYQLGTVGGLAPWTAVLLILPLFFALGVGLHAVFAWFRVREFTSLLVTFGVTVIIESLIQWYWTADFRRYETPYASLSFRVGPLYVPGVTGCYACQIAAYRRSYPMFDVAIEQRRAKPSPAATLGPACGLIGGQVGLDVMHHLTGLAEPSTQGVGHIYDLRTMEVEREPVTPEPDCPICGHLPTAAPRGKGETKAGRK